MGKIDRFTLTTRWISVGLLLMGLAPLTGCRICPDCEDIAYPAYGGSWQRTRRDGGRVGSVFDPGGAKTSELVPRDTPTHADELERLRQRDRIPRLLQPEEEAEEKSEGEQPREDLRQRSLEDMQDENENELRKKELRDIEVKVIPGQPIPPMVR